MNTYIEKPRKINEPCWNLPVLQFLPIGSTLYVDTLAILKSWILLCPRLSWPLVPSKRSLFHPNNHSNPHLKITLQVLLVKGSINTVLNCFNLRNIYLKITTAAVKLNISSVKCTCWRSLVFLLNTLFFAGQKSKMKTSNVQNIVSPNCRGQNLIVFLVDYFRKVNNCKYLPNWQA